MGIGPDPTITFRKTGALGRRGMTSISLTAPRQPRPASRELTGAPRNPKGAAGFSQNHSYSVGRPAASMSLFRERPNVRNIICITLKSSATAYDGARPPA